MRPLYREFEDLERFDFDSDMAVRRALLQAEREEARRFGRKSHASLHGPDDDDWDDDDWDDDDYDDYDDEEFDTYAGM